MPKQQNYQAIEVGETFGPVKFPVDAHFVKGFAFAVDDFSHLYFSEPGKCGPWAHSSGIAKKLLHLFMENYEPQGIKSVHLKEDIWFHSPVPFGQEIQLSGGFTDKFVKSGRPSVVLDSEARDQSGKLLVRQRSIEIVPTLEPVSASDPKMFEGLSGRRVSNNWPQGVSQVATAENLRAAGSILPTIRKTIHQDQMSMFVGANENWRNIHTDPETAKAAGFDTTIMSGMIQACWFTEMMVSFFGVSFLSGGQIGVTFFLPVKAGETIECRAVARKVNADQSVEIEFWSVNAEGRMTAGGWAIGSKAKQTKSSG